MDYFRRFPLALSQTEYETKEGMEARTAWTMLLCKRQDVLYGRAGRFEIGAGVGNFLAFLSLLFPRVSFA